MSDDAFWAAADRLCRSRTHVVDRPAGTDHPRYPGWRYPRDYGYLDRTTSGDGAEVDVWFGSGTVDMVTGLVCTVDAAKSDSEVKYLWRCTEADMDDILRFYADSPMEVLLVRRPTASA